MIRERIYSEAELCDLLEKAQSLGYSLDKGSELEKLTVAELERLITQRI